MCLSVYGQVIFYNDKYVDIRLFVETLSTAQKRPTTVSSTRILLQFALIVYDDPLPSNPSTYKYLTVMMLKIMLQNAFPITTMSNRPAIEWDFYF